VAILKYAKVLVLAPAIGSALIGIVGLVFGVVLIAGHRHSSNPALGRTAAPAGITSQHSTIGELRQTNPQSHIQSGPIEKSSVNPPAKKIDARLNFTNLIGNAQLAFLNNYADRVADDADGKQKVRALAAKAVPYTPFHLGLDMPLPQAMDEMLLHWPRPIEIRDGRYAMITGIRNPNGRGRAFLWVDMRKGLALGGIFLYLTNGEPSPTLTIFSRQLDRRTLRLSQLPRAFVEDLSRWSVTSGVPPITTRYFIGASGDKYVLVHDENYCVHSAEVIAPSPDGVCEEMNAKAALIDITAARFMEQTHNASNATARMIASTGSAE
jgi:hypothetical protein